MDRTAAEKNNKDRYAAYAYDGTEPYGMRFFCVTGKQNVFSDFPVT